MIVTQFKDKNEIEKSLSGVKRVFLCGCGDCATVCGTGSEQALEQWQGILEADGWQITGSCVPDVGCNAASVRRAFAKNMPALKQSQAVLVFSCGLGVQSAGDNLRVNIPVIPGCNTVFAGVTTSKGDINKACLLCGDCVLAETAGLCPKALCPKGMLNGPCGGVKDGKCEVYPERDCVWVRIYERLGTAGNLQRILPAGDYSKQFYPASVKANVV